MYVHMRITDSVKLLARQAGLYVFRCLRKYVRIERYVVPTQLWFYSLTCRDGEEKGDGS